MIIHNMQIFWVALFASNETPLKQQLTLKNENVGYLSVLGCNVLVSSVWKNLHIVYCQCRIK